MMSGIVGGLGLFLLGMLLLTENLKAVASDSVHAILKKFTDKPLTGLFAGASITALLQSSSATTLVTIGLVSSGLLSFPRSLSVIYGANLGTTSTAWIVSLVGLKLSMTAFALPLIGFGAFLRLFSFGVWKYVGLVIAGFAMIFLGIDFLQASVSDLSQRIDPSLFVAEGITGIVGMVLIGTLMTIIMQSSSAAIAVTLTLLHSGALNLEQSAATVIGQSIGTTVTAALGSVGSSIPAKRTALAHILFNLVTAIVALAILPVFLSVIGHLADRMFGDAKTISLSLFQTAFKLLGIFIFLPISKRFAQWIEKLLPEQPILAPLFVETAITGQVATLDAALLAIKKITSKVVAASQMVLKGQSLQQTKRHILELRAALNETYRFLRSSSVDPLRQKVYQARLSLLHAMDHIDRLTALLIETEFDDLPQDDSSSEVYTRVFSFLDLTGFLLSEKAPQLAAANQQLSNGYAFVSKARQRSRMKLLEVLAQNQLDPEQAASRLDHLRSADQIAYHAWRASHYLLSGFVSYNQQGPLTSMESEVVDTPFIEQVKPLEEKEVHS